MSIESTTLDPPPNRFRLDIQVMRAIAVIAVLVFHLNESWMPHGYLGVDMFFVISGFVITRGILDRSRSGIDFNLRHFLWRRINRLLPALLFTIGLVIILGFLTYPPSTYMHVAKSAIYAIAGVSNIFFFTQTNYFAPTSENLPLLHTWSLSVEEQFYLLFALLAWCVVKTRLKFVRWTAVIWIVLSVLSILFTIAGPTYLANVSALQSLALTDLPNAIDFYWLPSRIYQLGFGIVCACYVTSFHRTYVKDIFPIVVWLFFLLLAIVVIAWPDAPNNNWLLELLITMFVAGALICGEHCQNLRNARVAKLLGAVGDRSYSIYLIHWPIIVFINFVFFTSSTLFLTTCSLLVTFLISEFSWRTFEQRRKTHTLSHSYSEPTGFIYSLMLLCILPFVILQFNGFEQRMSSNKDVMPMSVSHQSTDSVGESEHSDYITVEPYNRKATERVLVLGDSHAEALMPMAEYFASTRNQAWTFYTFTGCPPIFGHYKVYGVHNTSPPARQIECMDQVLEWQHYVESNAGRYDYIVLSCRWAWMFNHDKFNGTQIRRDLLVDRNSFTQNTNLDQSKANFISGLTKTIHVINQAGAKAIVVGQPPLMSKDIGDCCYLPRYIFTDQMIIDRCSHDPYEEVYSRSKFVDDVLRKPQLHGLPKFSSLIPIDVFCDHPLKTCTTVVNGRSILRDEDHLSRTGSIELAKQWELMPNFPFKE